MKKKRFKLLLQSLRQALAHARGDRSTALPPEVDDDMAEEYDFPALKEQALREGRATEPECVRIIRRARAGEMFGYPVNEDELEGDGADEKRQREE